MAKMIWTEASLLDLNQIAEYIAPDKMSAAKKLVQRVFSRAKLLSDSSNPGRKPPELGKTRYREVVVDPCRIVYRANKNEIVIPYIMRGEQLSKKYILGERELKDN